MDILVTIEEIYVKFIDGLLCGQLVAVGTL
jgi:hypothetical protein